MKESENLFAATVRAHDCAACPDGPEECELCFIKEELPYIEILCKSDCRCGLCCSHLIIEATALDALREPRIAAECGPIIAGIGDNPHEVVGYMLNRRPTPDDPSTRCTFLETGPDGHARCGIYRTRPTLCRAFCCETFKADEIARLYGEQPCSEKQAS